MTFAQHAEVDDAGAKSGSRTPARMPPPRPQRRASGAYPMVPRSACHRLIGGSGATHPPGPNKTLAGVKICPVPGTVKPIY